MGVRYDPEHIARFFDEYGAREWDRFDASPMDRVNLEVHLRFLREHVRRGDRVLDAGAGPGRFTLELARLGATVVAGDISPGQLALHAQKTAAVEASVAARELLDIRTSLVSMTSRSMRSSATAGRSATSSTRQTSRFGSCSESPNERATFC